MESRNKVFGNWWRLLVSASAVMLLVCCLGLGPSCYAQNWNEIFRQKKTQEKYLLKQLAYLKLYGQQLADGYALVKSGLDTISGFTAAEKSLHELFFASLLKVKPSISADQRIAEIRAMDRKIDRLFGEMVSLKLDVENREFVLLAKRGMKLEQQKDLTELEMVLGGFELEFRDSERLGRLAKLHEAMLEKLRLARGLYAAAMAIVDSKLRDKKAAEELRRWYGLD